MPTQTTRKNGRQLFWCLMFSLGWLLLFASPIVMASKERPDQQQTHRMGVPATTEFTSLFLPILLRNSPLQTVFGVATEDANILVTMADAGANWTRRGVSWSVIEPVQGSRNWAALNGLAAELATASQRGMQVVLVVSDTPLWAQARPPYQCGAIKSDQLGAFADFMRELVTRYRNSVTYWEIWNEPDIDPALVPPASPYGCWGDHSDEFYGGGYYAQMLKAVYPTVKAADAQAQLMVGGLLLDCDPRIADACSGGPYTNRPSKFLEGILRNGGGNYFDGISFHAYDYGNPLGQYSNSKWNSAWNTTGPVSIAKARFIKSVLSELGVSGKFLMNTESAVVCDICTNDAAFEALKANYVAQVYAAAIAEGLRANFWYSALGWRNSGLLNADLSGRPALTAYQFARNEIVNATFIGNVSSADTSGSTGIKGYKLNRGDRIVWILWSLDGEPRSVILPGVPLAAWDVMGNSLAPSSVMAVSASPIYLEWNP